MLTPGRRFGPGGKAGTGVPRNALDRRRLLADLDATLADLRVGRWPDRAAKYWRLRGFEQALRVIRAGIVDGDYDGEDTSAAKSTALLYAAREVVELAADRGAWDHRRFSTLADSIERLRWVVAR